MPQRKGTIRRLQTQLESRDTYLQQKDPVENRPPSTVYLNQDSGLRSDGQQGSRALFEEFHWMPTGVFTVLWSFFGTPDVYEAACVSCGISDGGHYGGKGLFHFKLERIF